MQESMAIYLIKGLKKGQGEAAGGWASFTQEEISAATAYIQSRGFLDKTGNGDYFGPGGQYVVLDKSMNRLQVQEAKKDIMEGLIAALKPKHYNSDTNRKIRPIRDLAKELNEGPPENE